VRPLKPKKFSLATLLPLAELFVWFTLILVPAVQTSIAFVRQSRSSSNENAPFPFSRSLGYSLGFAFEEQFPTIVNLNLPGVLIGLPISVPVLQHLRAHPAMLTTRSWAVVTLPFFCLPAWWFVGRGLDAVLVWTRPRLGFRIIGSILCCACIAFAIAIAKSPPNDRSDLLPFMPGAILWAVAFGVFPFSWLLPRERAETQETA
jgi:hypothetical protein